MMESIHFQDAKIGLDQVVLFLSENTDYIYEAKRSINKLISRNRMALQFSLIQIEKVPDNYKKYSNLSFSIESNRKMIDEYEKVLAEIDSIPLKLARA